MSTTRSLLAAIGRYLLAVVLWLDRCVLDIGLWFGTKVLRLVHTVLDCFFTDAGPPLDDKAVVLWFDSSGLLLPYHIGVAEWVLDHYDCSSVVAAGISGGYAPAASIVMGITAEDHWRAVETLRALGGTRWLRAYFFSSSEMIHHGYLPQLAPAEDATLIKLAGGRMFIGCSEIWPRFGRAVWVNRFESAKAICHACTCSMRTLPILRLPGRIGRALVIDGVLACRPRRQATARNVIRVSVFPSKRASIAPERLLGGASDLIRLPSREKWDKWMHQGKLDAEAAAKRGVFAAAGLVPKQDDSGRRAPSKDIAAAAQAEHNVHCRLVVREGAAVLELRAREDQALLVRRDALPAEDLELDVVDRLRSPALSPRRRKKKDS